MSVRLVVKQRSAEGGAKTGTEQVLDSQSITLGRDKSCEVVLQEQAVSRKHARITRDGDLFFIEDLGSSYGTQVNGKKLGKSEKRLLRNGDTIAIAQFDVTFERVAELLPSSEKTSFIARQAVKDVMKGLNAEKPFLRVMNGKMEGQRLEIDEGQSVIIGRDPSCDLVLSDDLSSRQHAKVRRDFSGTHIEDLGSRNGIKVNKKRVKSRPLKDRDEVEIGGTRFLFLDPTEVREAPALEPEPSFEMTSPPKAPEPEPEPPPPEPEPEPPPPEPEPEPEPPAEEPPPEEAPPEEAPPPAAGEGKLTWVGIAVMVLLGLCVLGFIGALLAGA